MANQDYNDGTGTAPQPPVPPQAPPAPPVPPESPRYQRRGGISLGIVLIAIGVVFLLAQFIPGLAWYQLWPLIVVLVGGIQVITPDARDGWGISRIMDGIGTLIVGFVLLGNTTGVISWGVWLVLLSLWPVLVIAIKMHSVAGQLVSVTGSAPFGNPRFDVTRSDTYSDVQIGLDSASNRFVAPFAAGSMDVGLSDSVLWDVTLSTGATSLNADFTHVKLKELTVKTGASSLELRLGDVPAEVTQADVAIKAGVSSVVVTVPREAAVRVVASNGLSAVDVGGTLQRTGAGTWETPGFGSAARTYEINIESGVGSVSVKQS